MLICRHKSWHSDTERKKIQILNFSTCFPPQSLTLCTCGVWFGFMGIPIWSASHLWPLLCQHISLTKEWVAEKRVWEKISEMSWLWTPIWKESWAGVWGGVKWIGVCAFVCVCLWLESDKTRPAWWKAQPTANTNTPGAGGELKH